MQSIRVDIVNFLGMQVGIFQNSNLRPLQSVESWDWCGMADSTKLHQVLHADSAKLHLVLCAESAKSHQVLHVDSAK